jgi:cyclopropane-fatty-acyl-phospholipid synthase
MSFFRNLFFRSLRTLRGGSLELVCPDGNHRFGSPGGIDASILVQDERFFPRVLLEGDTGAGDSYVDGDWTSPDLTATVRLALRNLSLVENASPALAAFARFGQRLRHRLRANTLSGSRRNIGAHYDLSNDFFRLFLDRNLMYSSAFFESADESLEQAQFHKNDRICRKLRLSPSDHLLEIGAGWGGFAIHAANRYGCRVTTTTISRQQYELARERFARELDDPSRVTLLLEDYRNLKGRYGKLVSIEMFEAVGLENYDAYFSACDRLLAPDGAMLLQTITMHDQRFGHYRRHPDWIQMRIFPGGELASLKHILLSLERATRLQLHHYEEIGAHYALTLREWRRRFFDTLPAAFGLGFDTRFARMWDFYLSSCEAGFLERHTGAAQILLAKNYCPASLFGEPLADLAPNHDNVVTCPIPPRR